MPQLVRGGKHVFGWSTVSEGNTVPIPCEAADEYGFSTAEQLLLIKGSRTSGGFGLTCHRLLEGSPLGESETTPVGRPGREADGATAGPCAPGADDGGMRCGILRFTLTPEAMERFGVRPGDRLLVVRGSGRALGFLARGPIYEEAMRHDELVAYGDTGTALQEGAAVSDGLSGSGEEGECGGIHHPGGHPRGRGPSSFWVHDPEAIFEELGLEEGDSFLDLGCGPGEYSLHAARIVGGSGVVLAVDRSREMIDYLIGKAGSRGIGNVRAFVSDIAEPLPLDDDTVEVCLIATVLHVPGLVEKSEGLFNEIRRVLKPGGRLAVIECKKEETSFGPPLEMRLSDEEIDRLAAPCGFHRTNLVDLGNNYMVLYVAG